MIQMVWTAHGEVVVSALLGVGVTVAKGEDLDDEDGRGSEDVGLRALRDHDDVRDADAVNGGAGSPLGGGLDAPLAFMLDEPS